MPAFTISHTRAGTSVRRPVYTDPSHLAMEFVLGARRFARVAGIRNAARALCNQGFPIRVAVYVLLRDPIKASMLVAAVKRDAFNADDNLGDC